MKNENLGLILVTPSVIFIFALLVFPLGYTVYCSMFKLDYLAFGEFLGLRNYLDILSNREIIRAIYYTLIISTISMIISMFAGMVLALWINSQKGIFSYPLQILGLIPWVTSMVVTGLLWRWIFDGDLGLLNYFLSCIGLKKLNIFGNAFLASIALIFVISWRTSGYSMLMILAGLKSIPKEIEDSAKVDGADSFNILWRIKIPLIKTPLLIAAIIISLSNFNNITVPMTLTGGGPGGATNVIALEMYRQGFLYYKFGIASTLSFIVFVLNIMMIVLYVRIVKYNL